MTEDKNGTEIEIQKKLVEIIERTKTQNEILKKLLETFDKKESHLNKLKQNNNNQNSTKWKK